MLILMAGLVIFLGVHSLRIVSESGRDAMVDRLGEQRYKGAYSVLSLAGFLLIVYGYGAARGEASQVYLPPDGLRHLTMLLVPIGFILVAAAYVPTGRIKTAVAHPMALGVGFWALGHLLANGTSADILLFGAFLVWAVADYAASYRRTGGRPADGGAPAMKGDILAVAVGVILSAIFIGGLHLWLFGVSPLG